MANATKIGQSIVGSFLLVVIFSKFWPHLPKEGSLGVVSWGLLAVVGVISGWIVIGPGQVALEMFTDSGF